MVDLSIDVENMALHSIIGALWTSLLFSGTKWTGSLSILISLYFTIPYC
jgi:hypothetical protein